MPFSAVPSAATLGNQETVNDRVYEVVEHAEQAGLYYWEPVPGSVPSPENFDIVFPGDMGLAVLGKQSNYWLDETPVYPSITTAGKNYIVGIMQANSTDPEATKAAADVILMHYQFVQTDVGTVKRLTSVSGGATKTVDLQIFEFSTNVTSGTGKAYYRVPTELDGHNLVSVGIQVGATQSSSGIVSIELTRLRAATAGGARAASGMLSTDCSVDANEWDSKDATTQAVIDSTADDVQEGDLIRVDMDGIGTGTQGLFLSLGFSSP